jgi:hypothetical protein
MNRAAAIAAAPLLIASAQFAHSSATTSTLAACGSSSTECECADDAIEVSIPAEAQGDVDDVALSGNACTGVTATCENPGAGGCAVYRVAGIAAGDCHVDVDFKSGTRFSADVTLVADSCCAGFYANPASADEIDVPAPSFDAGSE